jgi:hypothetical protein
MCANGYGCRPAFGGVVCSVLDRLGGGVHCRQITMAVCRELCLCPGRYWPAGGPKLIDSEARAESDWLAISRSGFGEAESCRPAVLPEGGLQQGRTGMAILRCNQRAGTSLASQSRQISPIRETGVADTEVRGLSQRTVLADRATSLSLCVCACIRDISSPVTYRDTRLKIKSSQSAGMA